MNNEKNLTTVGIKNDYAVVENLHEHKVARVIIAVVQRDHYRR